MGFTPKKKDDETKVYTPLTDPEFRKGGLSPMTVEERRKWEVMFARFHQPHTEITAQIQAFALPPGGEAGDALTTDGKNHYYWAHGGCYWLKAGANLYFATGNIAVGDIPNNANTIYAKGNILVQATDAQPYVKISNASDTERDPAIQFAVGATPSTKFTMGVDDSLNDAFVIGVGDSLGASVILSVDHTRENVILGYNAGYSRESSSPYLTKAVAIGEDALYNSSGVSPYGTIGIGYHAGKANTSGPRNIYIGYLCADYGSNAINGDGNILIGAQIGYQTASNIDGNTIVGTVAANLITTGDQNCLFGREADATLTTGSNNVGVGYQSIRSNQTGSGNVALGANAGYFETGSDHLWIDNRARASLADGQGKALIYGTFADAIANQYLYVNGNISTPLPITSTLAVGTAPLSVTSTTVNSNLNADMVDGYHQDQGIATTDGPTFDHLHLTDELFLAQTAHTEIGVIYKGGVRFLHNYHGTNAVGYNIFLGEEAGNFTSDKAGAYAYEGSYNIGIGRYALDALTTGYDNVGIGDVALSDVTSGYDNFALGDAALYNLTTGYWNVGIGASSLYAITDGYANVAIGSFSLLTQTSAVGMVAIGFGAGAGDPGTNDPLTDDYGILIGYDANRSVVSATKLTNYIGIGTSVRVGKNNQTVIGNSSTAETVLYGDLYLGATKVMDAANGADLLDGNHAAAFETAGAVTTHESTYNHANYNTAYGWGDHSAAGYLTSVTAHDLLSATHGDTTAAAVSRGAMIAGIGATPKWTAIAAGTEGYVWTMGANEPGWAAAAGGGAPTGAQYVCLATDAGLSAERVLTGTSNQITITDNGANGTVVLSAPQDIHSGAGPTFDHLHIGSTATVTTSATELILEETGDTFGTIRIKLRNRSGTNGMVLEDPSLDLIDLCFVPSTNKQQNIRLEGRSAYAVNANNTRGEFQFTDPDLGAIWFATGVGGTDFKEGNVGINDPAPAEKLDVNGNINVTGVYKVDDVQVVGPRVVDARCDDAINSGDATTDGVIDALRDAMIAHGLIAAS